MKRALYVAIPLMIATIAYGYEIRHPNLRDAFALSSQAIEHVHSAQQANKGIEFGGHAEKAIELLRQAQAELVEGDKYNEAHQKH